MTPAASETAKVVKRASSLPCDMSPRREFGMKGEAIYPIGATEPVVMQAGPDAVRVSPHLPGGGAWVGMGARSVFPLSHPGVPLGIFLYRAHLHSLIVCLAAQT